MQGKEKRTSLLEIGAHVRFGRVEKCVSYQDEVGLKMLDLEPRVAKQYFFESVDLVVGDVDRKFCPVENVPERVMCLITKEHWNAAAR